MKRCRVALFVWLVCLSIPAGALSAPYTHVHRDATHDTNHHDGRQVHRHGTDTHEHPDQQDHQDHDADASTLDGAAGLVPRFELADAAITAQDAPATVAGVPAGPSRALVRILPPGQDRPPDDPPAHPSPLRGPPR